MPINLNGTGAIVGSDRAESGVNDDITALAAALQLNTQALDDLFILADTL